MRTRSGASVACCHASWVTEYARRVESMMRSYLRGGRSLVYWLTLPAPRGWQLRARLQRRQPRDPPRCRAGRWRGARHRPRPGLHARQPLPPNRDLSWQDGERATSTDGVNLSTRGGTDRRVAHHRPPARRPRAAAHPVVDASPPRRRPSSPPWRWRRWAAAAHRRAPATTTGSAAAQDGAQITIDEPSDGQALRGRGATAAG